MIKYYWRNYGHLTLIVTFFLWITLIIFSPYPIDQKTAFWLLPTILIAANLTGTLSYLLSRKTKSSAIESEKDLEESSISHSYQIDTQAILASHDHQQLLLAEIMNRGIMLESFKKNSNPKIKPSKDEPITEQTPIDKR